MDSLPQRHLFSKVIGLLRVMSYALIGPNFRLLHPALLECACIINVI